MNASASKRQGSPGSEDEAGTSQSSEVPADDASELHPGDTYRDGPYVVFTAQYHLRRGYCCNSGCRHCPYR